MIWYISIELVMMAILAWQILLVLRVCKEAKRNASNSDVDSNNTGLKSKLDGVMNRLFAMGMGIPIIYRVSQKLMDRYLPNLTGVLFAVVITFFYGMIAVYVTRRSIKQLVG